MSIDDTGLDDTGLDDTGLDGTEDPRLRPGQRGKLSLPDDGPDPVRRDSDDGGDGPPGQPGQVPVIQPRLGPIGWLRWMWRQLTSMRTALVLLMLLALASIPGSLIPQTRIDPSKVSAYIDEHPGLTPWVRRIDGFDVYGSPWFSAIYLLLFISLIGCVLPRSRQQYKAMRAKPPRAPRRLERMPVHASATTTAPVDDVLAAAATALRRKRYRVHSHDGQTVSADRGLLSETGNLMFHLALLGVLVCVGTGSFLSYSGQSVVVEGDTWANVLPQYDSFAAGRAVDADSLPPFSFTLKSLITRFDDRATGNQFGAARAFDATVDYRDKPGDPVVAKVIRVNHPLDVDGARVFLVGNGYAPVITVHDGKGDEVWSGPVPFLARDSNYTSTGVVKMPDAKPSQLGLFATLLPTAATDPMTGLPVSVFPALNDPKLQVLAFTGDLGLDDGVAQSVYVLDQSKLAQVKGADGKQFSGLLGVGQTVTLPGGNGTVTFDGVKHYAALDVRADPTKVYVLVFALMALFGVTTSLFVRRRRIWFRAVRDEAGDATVVSVGGLARTEDMQLADEVRMLLMSAVPVGAPQPDQPAGNTAGEGV